MEKKQNNGVLCNEFLFRMDDDILIKLKKHARENDMTLSAIIRRSLRQFFQREKMKNGKSVKKQSQKE